MQQQLESNWPEPTKELKFRLETTAPIAIVPGGDGELVKSEENFYNISISTDIDFLSLEKG